MNPLPDSNLFENEGATLPEKLEPTLQDKADKAFLNAKTTYFLGLQELKPYSPSRKVAAQSMGMKYPYIGDSGIEQMNSVGTYPGCQFDVIMLLWLLSLEDVGSKAGDWTPARALGAPDRARMASIDWAGDKCPDLLNMQSDTFSHSFGMFMAIVQDVEASEFYLKEAGVNDTFQDQQEANPT